MNPQGSSDLIDSLIDNLTVGVYRTAADGEGRFLHANPAMAEMFGFASVSELLETTVLDLHCEPGARDELIAAIQEFGVVRDRELHLRRRDGSSFWASCTARAHLGPDGEIEWIDGVLEDITERRSAKEEREVLLRLARRLTGPLSPHELGRVIAEESRGLFDHSAMFLLRCEPVGNLLHPVYGEDTFEDGAVPRECELAELERGTLHAQPTLINRGPGEFDESMITFGDRGRRSCSLLFAPIHWEGHQIGLLSVQSYSPDQYTERDLRLLEAFADHCAAALDRVQGQQTQTMLWRAIEQSPAAITITDTEGAIEYVNPSFTAITGYRLHEVLGRNPRILKSGFTQMEVYEDLWSTILAGGEWRGELHNRRRDGSLYWSQAIISGIRDAEGAITHFIDIQEDVTEKRRAEKLAAIGLTAAHLAHHIKNVLSHMNGATRLLDRVLRDSQEPTVQRTWPILRRSAGRMSRLSHNMLALARESESARTTVAVNEAILNLLEDCAEAANLAGVRILTDLDPNLPPALLDFTFLTDCVLNLVNNAIEALDMSDSVERCVWVSTAFDAESHRLVLRFRDSGPGIPPEVQEQIFEPFFSTKGSRGTGLGLAALQKGVAEHGGSIHVESKPGRGTEFIISLPHISPEPGSRAIS
ncbi:PAS domain S-box protein [Candidatus Sumerlaeota bacterium]|nr:PAS domain S-box protein [Candidatus Sumerlaeota bacterium]